MINDKTVEQRRMWKLDVICALLFGGIQAQNQCQIDRLNAVKSGQQPVRGTNLGSWFVLEAWMANIPWEQNNCDKFAAEGSYLLEKCLGDKAAQVMEQHWKSWIVEDDFVQMSRHGINMARLPVGWWHIYDPDGGVGNAHLNWNVQPRTYAAGGLKYIDQAFEWGQKYGVAILLDMHAAPGSQNGNDNSSPMYPGQIEWDKSNDNVLQTLDSWELYAKRYSGHPALYGFAVLNEPNNVNIDILQNFYKQSYDLLRRYTPDAFILINGRIAPFDWGTENIWTNFMNPEQGYNRVSMDIHFYSCFGGDSDISDADGAINYIRTERQKQINDYKNVNPKPLMIGEWSACGHYDRNRAEDFTKAQVDVYNTAGQGWTFWSWHVDGAYGNDNDLWSLKTLADRGWVADAYPC